MKTLLLLFLFAAQLALGNDTELSQCREIEDDASRVNCYDRFVATYVALGDANCDAAAELGAVPDGPSLFGTSDSEAQRQIDASLNREPIQKIEATVSHIRRLSTGRLTIVLENGHIWRQLDDRRLNLLSGSTVTVRRGSFGSYLMQKTEGGRSIRVKRLHQPGPTEEPG